LPALEDIDQIGYRSLLLGFPFMTLGLVAGSVVAESTYGRVDFQDPKILLSLLMWAVYLVMVYTRWIAAGVAARPQCWRVWRLRPPSWPGRRTTSARFTGCFVMRFQLIGVNHNTAPVEVRERLAIPESRLPEACKKLAEHPGIEEGMILSTCNRSRSWPTRKMAQVPTSVVFYKTIFISITPNSTGTSTSTPSRKPSVTCSAWRRASIRW